MKKVIIVLFVLILMVVATYCGVRQSPREDTSAGTETAETVTEQETSKSEPLPETEEEEEEEEEEGDEYELAKDSTELDSLEGKWTDEFGITELLVEGDKAVLNGNSIGIVNGTELDFPNDYKKTETDFIDGKLYLTFTVHDFVAEEAGIPKGHKITVVLTKADE